MKKRSELEKCSEIDEIWNILPINSSNLIGECLRLNCKEIKRKDYSQEVYYEEELVNERVLSVIAIVPKSKIERFDFKIKNKDSVLKQVLVDRKKFSVRANIFSFGDVLIRFYKNPIEKPDVSPPEGFKSKVKNKNGDSI